MEPEVHRPPPTASVAEARQWEDKIRVSKSAYSSFQTTQREVALVMDVIRADIGRMQERGGRLDSLAERASVLDTSSHEFQRCANAVQQKAEQETSVTSLLMVVVVTLCIVFMFSVSSRFSFFC
ncbi:hypothetical protein WR25_20449 [Diploscapter pachys]|uniref:V-SNARE coiled-coil homology domain-containing protein n=1 Tax=Diploscapter pachys TaxID=2018661 RepID=A0A2A2LJS5_9BILA|nr:hypothetical protein WR25_20449 [Diploscapter pachys]